MFNIIDLDFNNHFWLKSDNDSVYSSKEDKYMPTDDEQYRKWLSEDKLPTSHPRDTEGNETYQEMLVVLSSLGVGRRYELLSALDNIDSKYRTLRTIANAQIGDKTAIERLKEAEKLSNTLREELANLS